MLPYSHCTPTVLPLYSHVLPLYSHVLPLYSHVLPLYSHCTPTYSHCTPMYSQKIWEYMESRFFPLGLTTLETSCCSACVTLLVSPSLLDWNTKLFWGRENGQQKWAGIMTLYVDFNYKNFSRPQDNEDLTSETYFTDFACQNYKNWN
jgi:hypothetical protein